MAVLSVDRGNRTLGSADNIGDVGVESRNIGGGRVPAQLDCRRRQPVDPHPERVGVGDEVELDISDLHGGVGRRFGDRHLLRIDGVDERDVAAGDGWSDRRHGVGAGRNLDLFVGAFPGPDDGHHLRAAGRDVLDGEGGQAAGERIAARALEGDNRARRDSGRFTLLDNVGTRVDHRGLVGPIRRLRGARSGAVIRRRTRRCNHCDRDQTRGQPSRYSAHPCPTSVSLVAR